MLPKKTRKSTERDVNHASPGKKSQLQPDYAQLWPLLGLSPEGSKSPPMPVVGETPLEFFEKFYAPHGNPNWNQLDARGLAQIIIDADQRRAEFQTQMAANSLPSEEAVQTSRMAPSNEARPRPPLDLPAHTKFNKGLLSARLQQNSAPASEEALQQSDQKYYQSHQYPHREKELNPEEFDQFLEKANQRRADVQARLEENLSSEEEALQDSGPQPVATSNDHAADPATNAPEPIEIENGAASINVSKENQFTTVKVSRGDTLFKIAKKYGTTVADIMKDNKDIKDANSIRTGQKIKIPKKFNSPPLNVAARDGATVEHGSEESGEAISGWLAGSNDVGGKTPNESAKFETPARNIGAKNDADMKMSARGVSLLKSVEKLALQPYDDQTGKPITKWTKGATIGYGHLISENDWKLYKNGITAEEAESLFERDISPFVRAVNKAIKVKTSQHQFDAAVMLAYNIGKESFPGSSAAKLINNPNASTSYKNLERAWKAWNKSQGKVMPGLINRRNAEWNIYSKGVYKKW